jgi:hypothetical protein
MKAAARPGAAAQSRFFRLTGGPGAPAGTNSRFDAKSSGQLRIRDPTAWLIDQATDRTAGT